MKYIVESEKTLEQAAKDLETSVVKHKFGIMHIHDLQATLRSKGFDFTNGCKVFEVCNPQQAYTVLEDDMGLNMALPCRISIWEENGKTIIGMLNSSAILSMLSTSEVLSQVGKEVENITQQIIDDGR